MAYLQAWSATAPWPDMRQVEQDLIICRALCDIFNHPELSKVLAFRGGTAINKLIFKRPLRYSEDIDLVQLQAGPIGPIAKTIRQTLSWVGESSWQQAAHSIHIVFRFSPEIAPGTQMKLKVEINTREHSNLHGVREYPFSVANPWHTAETQILCFESEELFGTKLRALLQRSKNRDLFDLKEGLTQLSMDTDKIIACLEYYLSLEEKSITRATAEQRMLDKLRGSLTEDIAPLLPAGVKFSDEDALNAFELVWLELIARIKGDPWKLSEKTIDELRTKGIPNLLKKK